MSKLSITPSTVEVANIQALPDLVVGQATSLKQKFDKTGSDTKTYINDTLIPELNGDDGAFKIGLTNPELLSNNVGDGITEVLQIAKDAQAGTIIDGSIEDIKLSNAPGQIKEKVSTLETDVSTIETDLNIIRTAVLDTGTVNNIVVDTAGTFDLTRNGNILTVIPLFTNTSSTVNISADAQTNKLIKKANDSGAFVAVEVGDIKKNVPTQLVWDSVSDFFIFAPKGGSSFKSFQYGTTAISSTTVNQTISNVDINKSVVIFNTSPNSSVEDILLDYGIRGLLTSNTNIEYKRERGLSSNALSQYFVYEYKTSSNTQKGTVAQTGSGIYTGTITVSAIDLSKPYILFLSLSANISKACGFSYKMLNNTTIQYVITALDPGTNFNVSYQLLPIT